jgi:hypothetical protein
MRLVLTENITLERSRRGVGRWFAPAGDETTVDNTDIEDELRDQMAQDDGLLLGRVTFEEFRGYLAQSDRRHDGDHRSPQPGGEVRRVQHPPDAGPGEHRCASSRLVG